MELLIRKFQQGDFQEILEIEREAFKEPHPELYVKFYEWFSDGFLVAEISGELVGYVVVGFEDPIRAKIYSIAVKSGWRGKGIGRELMLEAIKIAKSKGARYMSLEVRLSNHPAQNLYRSLGFHELKLIPNYYPDGEDAILMEKSLE